MPRPGPIAETVRRHWTLLRLLPRAPRKIDSATLERLLVQEGFAITRRSVQRDLEHLSGAFASLRRDHGTKPYGWCWDGDAPMLEIPAMGLSAAVTFELLESYMRETLPRATLKTLQPHFVRARQMLATHTLSKLARWPEKVRVLPRGLPLQTPEIEPCVLDVVYASLLDERRFRAAYRPRGAQEDKEYVVNPLGLVLRGGSLTLVCTFWDYENVSSLLLHRMKTAEPLAEAVRKPRDFDFDRYLAEGGAGFPWGEPVEIELWVADVVATTLHETPLSTDQELMEMPDGRWRLRAVVPNTIELRGFIQGYGPLIEVREPAVLRAEIAQNARRMAELYASPSAAPSPPPTH